jgi:thioesterase domain-containing protein
MRALLGAFFLLFVAGLVQPAHAAGHIYLLRGFAGIFSTGLDELGEMLTKRGYKATVHSYTEYPGLAEQAAAEQKSGKGPIVIIGHSFGAEAAISMAEEMKKRGASVALIVSFAPTVRLTTPSNVRQVVNYYQGEVPISKTSRSGGHIANVNLTARSDVNHFNIEKIQRFQMQVLTKVRAVVPRR